MAHTKAAPPARPLTLDEQRDLEATIKDLGRSWRLRRDGDEYVVEHREKDPERSGTTQWRVKERYASLHAVAVHYGAVQS